MLEVIRCFGSRSLDRDGITLNLRISRCQFEYRDQQCLLPELDMIPVGSPTQLTVKLAFILGSFLILFPLLLRTIDAVDNSLAFTFIAIGSLVVIIAELNRVRVEELSPFN